jgi:hypothetical protein
VQRPPVLESSSALQQSHGLWLIGTTLFFQASASDELAAYSVKGRFHLTSEGPWTRFMDLVSGGAWP